MKNTAMLAAVALSLFAFACNSKNEKGYASEKEKTATVVTDEKPKAEEGVSVTESDVQKAAIGYCECFNQNYGDLDPKLKSILIKAGKSNNPAAVLQRELMSASTPADQQQLADEMQKLSDNKAMDECTNRISRTYNLNEKDPKTQRQVMEALEQNKKCDLVAALMRIGIQQQEANGGSRGPAGQ